MRLLLIIGIAWCVVCVVLAYSACIMAGRADDVRGVEVFGVDCARRIHRAKHAQFLARYTVNLRLQEQLGKMRRAAGRSGPRM